MSLQDFCFRKLNEFGGGKLTLKDFEIFMKIIKSVLEDLHKGEKSVIDWSV